MANFDSIRALNNIEDDYLYNTQPSRTTEEVWWEATADDEYKDDAPLAWLTGVCVWCGLLLCH